VVNARRCVLAKTSKAISRRLQLQGLPMVVMPIRITDLTN
jgi:hypothetical protein